MLDGDPGASEREGPQKVLAEVGVILSIVSGSYFISTLILYQLVDMCYTILHGKPRVYARELRSISLNCLIASTTLSLKLLYYTPRI